MQEVIGGTNTANSLSGGIDEVFQRTDSAGARSFLTDALGSTLALTDSSGTVQTSYSFEPFGNTAQSGSSTTNSFAYTGRELDAGNLYFYRARYYSPALQRFISEDPARLGGGDTNFYAYVRNMPTNLRDPFGLDGGGTATVDAPPIGVNPPEPTSGMVDKVIESLEGTAERGLVGIGNVLGAAGMILLSPTPTNMINGESEDDIVNRRVPQPMPPMAGRNCKGNRDDCKLQYTADIEWCDETFGDDPALHLACTQIADINAERCLDGLPRVNPDPRWYRKRY